MYFPQELINLVVEYSEGDLRTLVRLCLVSRACFHVARPLLYRKVRAIPSRNPKVVALGKTLFAAITSDSQLASYVRELTLDADFYSRESGVSMPTLLTILRETLSSMTRLRKLRLVLPDGCDAEFPIDPVFVGHDFQLDEFFWRDFRWYVHLQAQLDKFLASQTNIKTLEIASGPDATPSSFDIAPTACPDLKTFSGNFLYFKSLAPTRPITNFVWSGVSPVPMSVLDEMSPSFSRLRVLIFHEGFPNDLDLPLLASHLNSLEVLHLSLEDTRTTFQSYRQIQNGQKFVHQVHKLTNLRVFVLSVHPPQLQFHEHSQRILTHEWFNALPHLERAYFNGAAMDSEGLLCWTRGETLKPRRTQMEEVYEMYRAKYALETALLKPFLSISRSVPDVPGPSPDELGRMGVRHDRKELDPSIRVTQAPWWKRLFWDTISLSIVNWRLNTY